MKIKELFQKGKIIVLLTLALCGIYTALRYSDACYRGIEKGIGFCLGTLIPSLYFFMVIASFIVKSGIAQAVCRPLKRTAQGMFRLPAQSFGVILLSMIGGYPVGAACAAMLCEEKAISPSEAAKTAYIAVAAGPGFLVNYIGESLLGSSTAGYILLGAQIISVILTGIIVGRTVKSEPLPRSSAAPRIKGNVIVSAVQSASRSALSMCAMVVVFSALTEVVDTVVSDPFIGDITAAVIEITNGCYRIAGRYPLYITAFFVGFGGLSVHFQIFATLIDIPVKKHLFFLFRMIEGIIAMAATYIYLMIAPTTVTTVFNSLTTSPSAARSATLAGSAALVISSVLFVGSMAKKSLLHHDAARTTRR